MHAVTVRLTEADATAHVALHIGDRLRIDLPAAPAAGYRWRSKKQDASHLEAMGQNIRPGSGHLDAAGTQIFVWKAISVGAAVIALEYGRPGDDRILSPAKQMNVDVDVLAGKLDPVMPDDPLNTLFGPVASYRGLLPCGNCSGVAVEVTLYAKTASDFTDAAFIERRRYQGMPGADRTTVTTGKLVVRHGTPADHSMTVYQLSGEEVGVADYQFEGDRLLPLDAQMLPITTPSTIDLALHKVPQEDASEP